MSSNAKPTSNAGFTFSIIWKLSTACLSSRKAPCSKKLAEISDISTLSKEEHEKYDESIKNYRDTMAAFKEARAEGQSEAKREIARNLLKDAIPFSTIAAWTGLTEEEIAQLNAECDA